MTTVDPTLYMRVSGAEEQLKRIEEQLLPELQRQQNKQAVDIASLRGLMVLSIVVAGFGFVGVMVVLFFVVQMVTYFRVVP